MNRIEVFALDAEGKAKRIKAQALKLVLADGSVLHAVLDHPEGLLLGAPADESQPARLLLRPGAANAVLVAVERDEAAASAAELDLTVQYAAKPKHAPSKKRLREWVWAALGVGQSASITVRIVDEEEGRALNRDYRGKDYATNVLSFVLNEGEAMPGMDGVLMGDIVLCAPVVAREAAEQGKDVQAHWAHLVVHGVLHLQGYDHQDDSEAEAMETLETAILAGLGLPDPYAAERGAPDA
jgi:probable rRNA maturation factor